MRTHPTLTGSNKRTRGQTVVEFALVLPVLVLLLLMAVDFGRIFLGWVSLNNAARVGANYAAANPNETWGAGSDYQTLMAANVGAINCQRNPDPAAAPSFGPTKNVGDPVRVNLGCDFRVLTPVISNLLGGTISVSSSATFPITDGCLAACPTGPPAPPPPPPANNCRTVPDVVGLSVAGARNSWVAAGFSSSNFSAPSGSDSRTVRSATVTEPFDEGCTGSEKVFASSMAVLLEDLGPVTSPTCLPVPNLLGISVADARSVWTTAGFSGDFLPLLGNDTRRVEAQVTDPASDPGDCLEPPTSVTVAHGAPLGSPPPPPCKVPSFINTSSATATSTWTAAGFQAGNISFSRGGTFQILSQTLVGGTFVSCSAEIELSHRAGNTP